MQIIASLTQNEKQKLVNALGHRQKKTMPCRSEELDFALGAPGNQCSAFTLLPMKTAIPWKTMMNQAGGCEYWYNLSGAHRHNENILRYVQKAPDNIRCEIDRNEFDELMATKESAPGTDGIPYSLYRCAGGVGSQFLLNAHKHVLEGGTIPAPFDKSSTVFIPKSYDVDNNSRILRLPEALRPLTL